MAAILCESISKILRGSCEAVGTVLTLPCKACGFATEEVTKLCRSPFCLYITVALGLNIPPIIFAGKGFVGGGGNGGEACASAATWLYVNALLCLIHIAAAVYVSLKITHVPEEDENAAPYVEASVGNKAAEQPEKTLVKQMMKHTLGTDSRAKSCSRVREIICYDPVVAIYIIIGLFYMVWQTMGLSHMGVDCGEGLDGFVTNSIMCGFMFMSLGGMAFGISVCCLGR